MDPIKALFAYTTKLDPLFVKEDLTLQKPAMIVKFQAATLMMVDIEDSVRGLLGMTDQLTVDYPYYYAFAKEVMKVTNRFSGGLEAVAEVGLLVAKWKARGLDEDILDDIRDIVFAIVAPTP